MKASDLFVQCLEAEGVEYIFGIPGEENIDLMDSLSRSSIQFVIARHEQGAAFMADMYGRLTGKPGVCLATLGPGAANLVTGVANAHLDRVPLVAITGQATRTRLHKESHQNINTVKMFEPITKYSQQVLHASIIPEVIRKSFQLAVMENPGAIHIQLPEDVAQKNIEGRPLLKSHLSPPLVNESMIQSAVDIISQASHPVILAGNGVIRSQVWNEVRALVAHKVGPAIAAGNTIILKPAEQTPLSSLILAELFQQAGLPAGVLNIIPGSGAELGEILTTHPKVAFITFTGSPQVGKLIRAQAGLRRVTLELGSNSPLLIDEGFSPEELEKIADETTNGSFNYDGQVCISIQRVYVHKNIYDGFVERMVQRAEKLKIGDPLAEDTNISALINTAAADRLKKWVEHAVSKGAIVQTGGTFEGNVMAPTILTNVSPDAELNTEEAFGPIITITPFETWSEAIDMANRSKFGLNSGAFTKDIERAFQAAEKLESAMQWKK